MRKRTYTFAGWILRKWTQTSEHGWTASIECYDSFEKALNCGRIHNMNLCDNELSRDFEIYKNLKEEFVETDELTKEEIDYINNDYAGCIDAFKQYALGRKRG